jgi:hypothetical protein
MKIVQLDNFETWMMKIRKIHKPDYWHQQFFTSLVLQVTWELRTHERVPYTVFLLFQVQEMFEILLEKILQSSRGFESKAMKKEQIKARFAAHIRG